MIPNTLDPEIRTDQTETRNEVEATQNKNSVEKSRTVVQIREIPKQRINEETEDKTKSEVIYNVVNEEPRYRNEQEHITSDTIININKFMQEIYNPTTQKTAELGYESNLQEVNEDKMENIDTVYRDIKSAAIINIDSIDMDNAWNQKVVKGYPDSVIKPPSYWVQYNIRSGMNLPEGAPPLQYTPDRNIFVRIVFSIVLFMLILTAGFVAFVYMTSDLKEIFLRYGLIIMIVAIIGLLSVNYAMICSACTRSPPCNYIMLFLAVVFMSLLAAQLTVRYRTQIILFAVLATTAVVVVCLALACSSFDFTKYLLYMIVIATAFSAIAMVICITMFVTKTKLTPLTLAILVISVLIQSVLLVMELQMILGGRTVQLSEDDYALGAYMLYTSIANIFLELLQIIGILDN